MKNLSKKIFILAGVGVLMACSSGGGGSGATGSTAGSGGTTTVPTTPVNSVFEGLKSTGGSVGGTATYDAANSKYVYNFNGNQVDVTYRGITAGTVIDMTVGENKQMIGGTTYAYSRFGAIGPVGDLDAGDVFYVGQKTVNMPTSGIAVYKGLMIGLPNGSGAGSTAFGYAPVSFDVNFGAKTISGKVVGDPFTHFDQGVISGSSFAGKMSDDQLGGSYSGSFFGPKAEELGGVLKFFINADGSKSDVVSFGAKKQ